MKSLIEALRRFDSLETVIEELKVADFEENEEVTVDDLAEYLNDEADYANLWLALARLTKRESKKDETNATNARVRLIQVLNARKMEEMEKKDE